MTLISEQSEPISQNRDFVKKIYRLKGTSHVFFACEVFTRVKEKEITRYKIHKYELFQELKFAQAFMDMTFKESFYPPKKAGENE